MKMKVDLAKFKLKSRDEHTATLTHPDGHEVKIAIKALHPMNRKNLDSLEPSKPVEDPTQEHLMQGDKLPNSIEKNVVNRKKSEMKMADGGIANNPKLQQETKQPDETPVRRPLTLGTNVASGVRAAEGGKLVIEKTTPPDYEPIKPLEVEPINPPEPKNHITYEAIKPKNPVSYEPIKKMADGGDASDPQPVAVPAIPGENGIPASPQMVAPSDQSSPQTQDSSQQMPQNASIPQSQPEASQNPPQGEPQKDDSQAPLPTALGGYAQQYGGVQEQAAAEQRAAKEEAAVQRAQINAAQQNMALFQKHSDALEQERNAFKQDIIDKHIDPNRYLGSMDTMDRIMTGAGLILGGFGGSFHGGNQALDFLNRQIDRDIEAQKSDLGTKENLLSHNLQEQGNLDNAMQATRLQMNDILSAKLGQVLANSKGPIAQAHGQQLLGQLQQQSAPLAQQMALRAALNEGGTTGKVKMDPSMLVTQLVPPDKQKEVFGQIQAAQDTKRMGNAILNSFDEAAKDNTVLRTGAGLLRTPASVYALHQSMQPTFKDLEGTVRQAAMDNTFKNITPMPGDADSTIKTKRQALVDYLQSKASAPMAKGYGIDLNKFDSTSPNTGLTTQQQQYADWAKANPQDPRAKLVLKKLNLQ